MDLKAWAFFLLKFKNAKEGNDRSINRAREIVHEEEKYDAPEVSIGRLKALDTEIAADLDEQEGMLG